MYMTTKLTIMRIYTNTTPLMMRWEALERFIQRLISYTYQIANFSIDCMRQGSLITTEKLTTAIYLKKVANEAAELVRKNSLSEHKEEFVDYLNQSLITFYQERVDPASIKEIQSLFVLPVLEKIVEKYRGIDSAVQLAVDLKQANQIYESVVANNDSVLRWLQIALGRFTERVDILERLPK